ncbi:hypothetical protein C8T65DRAFT_695158 [Cerioporus squamosus]|nr:hypothetical protein C8T65DRAFT_695158 [Cerioporus squamosus]
MESPTSGDSSPAGLAHRSPLSASVPSLTQGSSDVTSSSELMSNRGSEPLRVFVYARYFSWASLHPKDPLTATFRSDELCYYLRISRGPTILNAVRDLLQALLWFWGRRWLAVNESWCKFEELVWYSTSFKRGPMPDMTPWLVNVGAWLRATIPETAWQHRLLSWQDITRSVEVVTQVPPRRSVAVQWPELPSSPSVGHVDFPGADGLGDGYDSTLWRDVDPRETHELVHAGIQDKGSLDHWTSTCSQPGGLAPPQDELTICRTPKVSVSRIVARTLVHRHMASDMRVEPPPICPLNGPARRDHRSISRLREDTRHFILAHSGTYREGIRHSPSMSVPDVVPGAEERFPVLFETCMEIDELLFRASQSVNYELSYQAQFPSGAELIDEELAADDSYLCALQDLDQYQVDTGSAIGDDEEDTITYPVQGSESPPPPWVPVGGWDLSNLGDPTGGTVSSSRSWREDDAEIESLLELEEWMMSCDAYEQFRESFPEEEEVALGSPRLRD